VFETARERLEYIGHEGPAPEGPGGDQRRHPRGRRADPWEGRWTDTGPGLAAGAVEEVFTAFHTTKPLVRKPCSSRHGDFRGSRWTIRYRERIRAQWKPPWAPPSLSTY